MDCRILRHVTLKADGHLGCDDSVGYGINLGHVSLAAGWRLRDVLAGAVYTHVRSSFKAGRVPWPGVCEGCDLLSEGGTPVDTLDTRLELLVEPTLAYSLSCACCLRKQIISKGRSVASLDPAILSRFVESCRTENIMIDQAHYIGWGEPLMHDNFRALFDIVKIGAPAANQMVTTAANVDFRSTVGDAPLDRLVVSCDGATPESYVKYRRDGDFDTVVRFMRDCKKYGSEKTILEWKYILFEFNDSDEEILRAQAVADDLGVDSLLFIITNSKWHSTRFTVDHARDVPITSHAATVSPAAAMSAIAISCRPFSFREEQGFGFIDRCDISVGKFLVVEGWALDRTGAYADVVELAIDGQTRARQRTRLRRADVVAAHPGAAGELCGFMFRIPIDPTALPDDVKVRISGTAGESFLGGKTHWLVPRAEVKRRADLLALPGHVLRSLPKRGSAGKRAE